MKKIVAINGSPRTDWNTGTLIREAARGAEEAGAEVQVFDLYKLEKFTGCVSCFGCKAEANPGKCVYKDGLAPVLEAIREADGLIFGTPNYLGDVSSGFRALYERLIFQYISYKTDPQNYNTKRRPILFIMTSNLPEEMYDQVGYAGVLSTYQATLNHIIGPTKTCVSGNTLQVKDYSKYNWTVFDAEAKKEHHEEVFPKEKEEAYSLGAAMVKEPWE